MFESTLLVNNRRPEVAIPALALVQTEQLMRLVFSGEAASIPAVLLYEKQHVYATLNVEVLHGNTIQLTIFSWEQIPTVTLEIDLDENHQTLASTIYNQTGIMVGLYQSSVASFSTSAN